MEHIKDALRSDDEERGEEREDNRRKGNSGEKITREHRGKKVVEDFEQLPRDETVAAGEHIDHDQLAEWQEQQSAAGAPISGVIESQPSQRINPYLPEERQGMEMEAQVFGPPQYGSPDPTTAAGSLQVLGQHPLDADKLPEGHPSAISEDYAAGTSTTLSAGEAPTHHGEPSRSDLERHAAGIHNETANATDSAKALADEENVNLAEVEGTGNEGRITRDDVQNFVNERDSASDDDSTDQG